MELIQTPSSALLSILIGLGLSASCGFRIFVPPFIISLAALSGHLELSESFAWMSTLPAVTALGAAVALEIGAYYLPVLDHFLDTVAAPAAVVAGTIVSASIFTELSPMMSWSLALIAGLLGLLPLALLRSMDSLQVSEAGVHAACALSPRRPSRSRPRVPPTRVTVHLDGRDGGHPALHFP